MKKAVWIVNKHVSGESAVVKYYPYFLKYLKDSLVSYNIDLKFIFSSNLLKEVCQTENDYWYHEKKSNYDNKEDINTRALKLEKEYSFTFKQALYPELLQNGKHIQKSDLRSINLPECEISNLNPLVGKFEFLNDVIVKNDIDFVLVDQSTDAEIEFARAICLKSGKLFFRMWPGFFGRFTINLETEFCKDKIIEAIYDESYSYEKAQEFIKNYLENRSSPYESPEVYDPSIGLKQKIIKKFQKESVYSLFISVCKSVVKKIKLYYNFLYYSIERARKNLITKSFDPDKDYLFWGFHLTTEATIALRGLPYLNQTSIIESISRVLPFNYYLYVREHPSWRDKLHIKYLKKLSKLPNVRVIPTSVSIHDILESCKGVIAYNGTTGIEALMYGKPVLSFTPNSYYKMHPSVDFCSDLYQLSSKIIKLVNTKVEKKDTLKYLHKMFQISHFIPLEADKFFSVEDSKTKAKNISGHINRAIKICMDD